MKKIGHNSYKYTCYQTINIDLKNENILKILEKRNFSFFIAICKEKNSKNKIVSLLKKMTKRKAGHAVINYIIQLFLDSKDYEGALNYLKEYELTNPISMNFENLVLAHESHSKGDKSKSLEFIKKGLSFKFNKKYVDLVEDIELLGEILYDHEYLLTLEFIDLEHLFLKSDKSIFLEKMVELNPFIEEKYLKLAIERNLICKSALSYMLKYNCNELLLSLGIKYKLIDKTHEKSVKNYLNNLNK